MYKPLIAAWFCISILCHHVEFATAQLASQAKPAEELLVDYLLHADEISSNYCARIDGTVSVTDNSGKRPPFAKSVFGISATRGPKLSYHCWGEQSLKSDVLAMKPVGWREQIWDGKKRFRKMSGGSTGSTAREIEEEDKDGNKPVLVSMPLIDPLGMAISSDGEMNGDRSNIEKKKEFFLSAKFWKSSKLEKGDVVGYWLAPNEFSVAVIQFGHKVDFMPVQVEYYLWNKEEKEPGARFSVVKTQWKMQNNAKYYLPSAMAMSGFQGKDHVVETEFEKIIWADPEKWANAKLNFHAIAIAPTSVWRDNFLPYLDTKN